MKLWRLFGFVWAFVYATTARDVARQRKIVTCLAETRLFWRPGLFVSDFVSELVQATIKQC